MNVNISVVASTPSIVVIGLGNIGSQVVPLISGIAGVSHVILIDPDKYATSNLEHQRISAKNVGQLKVKVQQSVLRTLAADIAVETYACRVEAVPPARLRNSVILSCVNSRSARQSIDRIAFRLGVPWVDTALDREGSIRARVYRPEGDCIECPWGPGDYELVERKIPCNPSSAAPAATAAPLELGAIAAGLQVSLLRRVLSEPPVAGRDELAQRQWFFDVTSGRGWVGRYERNLHCRFDHKPWSAVPLPSARDITLGQMFAMSDSDAANTTFSVDGQTIVWRIRCPQCHTAKSVDGRLFARMRPIACRRCGGPMMPAAMDVSESLSLKDISAAWRDRPLANFGLVDGDIVTLRSHDIATHYEVGMNKTSTANTASTGASSMMRFSTSGSNANTRRGLSSPKRVMSCP